MGFTSCPAWLGEGTDGFGAASSSWSREWLMICAQGRTNPHLQRDANTACCARRRLCCSYLRQQPLSAGVRAGLCVQGVSTLYTKHSRSSSLCCRAAAPHSNESSAFCARGTALQISLLGKAQGRAAQIQGAQLFFKSYVGQLASIRQMFGFGRVKSETLKVFQSELLSRLYSSVLKVWDLI